MKILKILIPVIALIAGAQFAYCETPQVVTYTDDQIPAATRNAIHKINDILCKSMQENKSGVMINMFTEEGRTSGTLETDVTDSYKKVGELAKGATFTTMHEYLIEAKEKKVFTVPLPGDRKNKFLISADGGKGSLFISLLVSRGSPKDIMLSFVYIKTAQGWQLYSFHYGIYKVGGRTAAQWYEEARGMYERGWTIPAMQWMQFVSTFIRPAPFIQYEKEAEMIEFFKNGGAEVAKNYNFPFKANWVKNTPVIYGLDTRLNKNNLMPVIVYVTKYPLNRGVAIQEEADAISSKLEKEIPGITRYSSEIGYNAFTEPPVDKNKNYKYRSVISKVR
ncbi:MAG: hypothetical protein PHX20_03155 [Candidatus Omnitrophica bacterium]|nr:hypothetical protein [Candidatus Omnitrophota bacterium]